MKCQYGSLRRSEGAVPEKKFIQRKLAVVLTLSLLTLSISAAPVGAETENGELPTEIEEIFGDDISEAELVTLAERDDQNAGFVGWLASEDRFDDAAKPSENAGTDFVANGADVLGPNLPEPTPGPVDTEVVAPDVEALREFVDDPDADRFIVTLRTDLAAASEIDETEDKVIEALPADVVNEVEALEMLPVLLVPNTDEALDVLLELDSVANIEADQIAFSTLEEVTDLVGSDELGQGGIGGTGQGVDGFDTYAVAVLDTGVDRDHGAFEGRVISEACFARGWLDGEAGDCPNGAEVQLGAGSGNHCDIGASAFCGHGSHVAGIAVGSEPAGAPANADDGIATGANLVAIQVFSDFGGGAIGSWSSDQLLALDRVSALVDAGVPIRAVNMSLGGGRYFSAESCDAANSARKLAIDTLRSKGVATVVSAGNNGWTDSLSAPGCISSAVTVGATTDSDSVATFSNSADWLDYWAPGQSVVAPAVGDNTWVTRSGTSMSAPVVAGAYAVLSQCGFGEPVGLEQIEAALDATGPNVTRGEAVTRRVDVLAAAQYLNPNDRFADATPISIGLGESSRRNDRNRCGTALDPGEPGEATTWFRIDPGTTGTLHVELRSNFDTQLRVFTASGDGAVSSFADLDPQLAFDDDSGTGLNAAIVMPVNSFKQYWVQVDGFAGAQGDFRLTVSLDAPPTCAGIPVTAIHDYPSGWGAVEYTANDDVVLGTPGNDEIKLLGGNDVACLGAGDDIADGGGGADAIFGGDGVDGLAGGNGVRRDFLAGGDGNDIIAGHAGDDILNGGEGSDTLFGGGGRDRLTGGLGEDDLRGGSGRDFVRGSEGDDHIVGGAGDDYLHGESGNDTILGGVGDDDIRGGDGEDSLYGGVGNDFIFGQSGSDVLNGNSGDDSLFGSTGDDTINGGAGNDVAHGHSGNDVLTGGAGDDVLAAGAGADRITGGSGEDNCNFGSEADEHRSGCESISNLP